jgi:glycosyltransferase involved in cell wall biosynthesis
MNIGINLLYLIPNKVGGTEYYARNFIESLQKIDDKNNYIIFCNQDNFESINLNNKKWKKVKCNIWATNRFARIIYEQLLLPFQIKKHKCSILHSMGYSTPFFGNFIKITTIHDVNWKDQPSDNNFSYTLVANLLYSLSIFFSHLILTDSQFSKNRLIYFFPKAKQKIKVIQPGIDKKIIDNIKKNHKHPLNNKKFILCVSNLYTHKRIKYLLKLWSKFVILNPDIHLVLIGKMGADKDCVFNLSESLPNFHWLDKVSLEKLCSFYAHSSLFILPSIYEGFGFPVYEALYSSAHVLVGKKELYSIGKNQLHELYFHLEKDKNLIKLLLDKQKPKRILEDLPNYNESTKKLIKSYSSFKSI